MSYKKVVKISHILFEQEKGGESWDSKYVFQTLYKPVCKGDKPVCKRQTLD